MISIEDFVANKKTSEKKGKLNNWKKDILLLRYEYNLSYKEIAEYLAQNNVTATLQAIRYICVKNSNTSKTKPTTQPTKQEQVQPEAKKTKTSEPTSADLVAELKAKKANSQNENLDRFRNEVKPDWYNGPSAKELIFGKNKE